MTITTIDARITVILLCILVFGLNPKASGQAISQRLPDRYFTERDSCCNQAWLGGLFPVFSSSSILNDSVVFDDGTGPAVYFVYSEMIGNELANGVIKWDGTNWSSVGDGPGSGQINLITVLDDGSGPAIYIAGGFLLIPHLNILQSGTVSPGVSSVSGPVLRVTSIRSSHSMLVTVPGSMRVEVCEASTTPLQFLMVSIGNRSKAGSFKPTASSTLSGGWLCMTTGLAPRSIVPELSRMPAGSMSTTLLAGTVRHGQVSATREDESDTC